MNDKELADAVVALGVGQKDPHQKILPYQAPDSNEWDEDELFVRDWRVAGALMENVTKPATDPLISLAGAAFELLDTNMWDWYGDRKVFLDWRPK